MEQNETQICDFCSKKKSDVNILITGITGNICDSCVSHATTIVREERSQISHKKIKKRFNII